MAAFLLSLARRNYTRRNFRSPAACRLFSASSSSDPLADVSLGAGKLSSGGGSSPFSPDFTDLGLAGKLKTLAASSLELSDGSTVLSHGCSSPDFTDLGLAGKLKTLAASSLELSDGSTVLSHGCSSPDFTDLGLAGKLKTLAACPSEKVSSPFSHGIPKYARADAAALVDPSVVLVKRNTNNGGFGSSGDGSSPLSPGFGLAGKLKTLSLELSDGSTVLSHGCSSPDFTDLGPSFYGLAGKLKTLAACPSEKVSSPFSHGIPKYARVHPSVVLVKRNTNNGGFGSSGDGSSPLSPGFGLAGKLKTLSLELSDGSTVLSHGCSSPDFTDLGPSFYGLAGKLKTLAACPSEKVSSPFSHGIPKYARVHPSVVLVKRNTNNGGFGSSGDGSSPLSPGFGLAGKLKTLSLELSDGSTVLSHGCSSPDFTDLGPSFYGLAGKLKTLAACPSEKVSSPFSHGIPKYARVHPSVVLVKRNTNNGGFGSSGDGSSPLSPGFGLAGKLKTLSLELSDGSTVLSHGCSSRLALGPSTMHTPSASANCLGIYSIRDAAAKVIPSVVRLDVHRGSYGDKKTTTFGTGFFIDNHGTILTCLDLVRNPYVPSSCYSVSKNVIKVTLPSGDLVDGTLLGGDANLDVALVKVDIEDTAPVQLSSSPIRAGEWIVAIGSPEGIDFSITQGIISCVGRSKTELGLPDLSGKDAIFIQTDCVLSDGSQGSPLVNLEGEVIGVIVLSHTLCTGIGFAAPISTIVVSLL